MRNKFAALDGAVLSVSGILILVMAGNQTLMDLFGGQALPSPTSGEPGWVGVAFTRLFGAALATLGFVMLAASSLSGASARSIGGALLGGLVLLGLVTIIQAQAIWSTTVGWTLAGVVVLSCVAAAKLVWSASPKPAR